MIKRINETTCNILDEDRTILKTTVSENILLIPEKGKVLRNKINKQIISGYVAVGYTDSEDNYEEIDEA